MHIYKDNITIKQAGIENTELILTFIKELAEYEKLAHEVIATEETLKETLFGEDSKARVLISYYKFEPAGFVLYFYNYSTFLGRPGIYIEDLYVRTAYRGKGLGKALLGSVASIAKKENCGRIEWSVLDWNEPAIQFYKSLGAIAKDEWTMYQISGEKIDKLAGFNVS